MRQGNIFITNFLRKVHVNNNHSVTTSRHMAATVSDNHREWFPEEIINSTTFTRGYACVVVNRRVTVPREIVENLWQNAEYRCTVDGGSNRWKDFLLMHNLGNHLKMPDFITGDFDSITKETQEYFNNPAIQRVHTPDQNYTDFTKAIHVLEPLLKEKQINDIFVFHDTSGRIDHIMANIQTLYKATPTLKVYLLCGNSITWVLRPGAHRIQIPKDLVDTQRWCALLPVGGKAKVTTTGLKWNLDSGILEFGNGIVSSSNTYSSELVCIQTDNAILWSMGVFNFHDD